MARGQIVHTARVSDGQWHKMHLLFNPSLIEVRLIVLKLRSHGLFSEGSGCAKMFRRAWPRPFDPNNRTCLMAADRGHTPLEWLDTGQLTGPQTVYRFGQKPAKNVNTSPSKTREIKHKTKYNLI